MKKYYLIVLLLIILTFNVIAAEPDSELSTFKAGIELYNISFPTLNLELKSNQLGLTYNYGQFPYKIDDLSVEGKIHTFGAKYYLPIGYNDLIFNVGGGFIKTDLDYDESWIKTTGYNLMSGFEQQSNSNICWGGSINYMYFPTDEIDSQIVFSVNVKYKSLFDVNSRDNTYSNNEKDDENNNYKRSPEKIAASGSIDSVSLPLDVSGSWKLDVDFDKKRAHLSLSGKTEEGPFDYSGSGRPHYINNSVRFTIKDDFYDDGKKVKGRANITVTDDYFRANVHLRREDGVTAGAYIRGKTTKYKEEGSLDT